MTARISLIILVLLTQFSCTPKQDSAPAIPEYPFVAVIEKEVSEEQVFVGQVFGFFDIPIRARVEGFLEHISFNEGREVKKGQLLYEIESAPYKAELAEKQSKLAEAKTALVYAQNELNRIEPLTKMNALSQSDLDGAKAQKDAAISQVKAAEANLEISQIQLGYTRIEAPISGIIGKTKAKAGEFVGREPNPVILNVISRIDTIHVEFFITENEYLMIAKEILTHRKSGDNEEKEVSELTLILSDNSVHPYKGEVDFVDRDIDPTTGSILVQASFPNPDLLIRPGQFAKVRINTPRAEASLLIPQRCVKETQGAFNVYVINDNNEIQLRQVELGSKIKDFWIVNKGLKSGELVMYEGIQKVRTGSVVKPIVESPDVELLNETNAE